MTIEMIDGRFYSSDDGWATIWCRRGKRVRQVTNKQEADLVRFLVASGAAE